jgi:hypothetical protein
MPLICIADWPGAVPNTIDACLPLSELGRRACGALLEHWIRFWLIEHHPLGTFLPHMVAMFDWHRFIAIQLWIFVLFLIYETATELNHLFGEGELWHLLVTSRPSELPLNGGNGSSYSIGRYCAPDRGPRASARWVKGR